MATKIAAERTEPQTTVLQECLEDVEDRALVQAWLPKLKRGPKASGALKWDDVAGEWDDGKPVKAITG